MVKINYDNIDNDDPEKDTNRKNNGEDDQSNSTGNFKSLHADNNSMIDLRQ